jgi:hypothetical protein
MTPEEIAEWQGSLIEQGENPAPVSGYPARARWDPQLRAVVEISQDGASRRRLSLKGGELLRSPWEAMTHKSDVHAETSLLLNQTLQVGRSDTNESASGKISLAETIVREVSSELKAQAKILSKPRTGKRT